MSNTFLSPKADVALSDILRRVKSSSSKWVNESHNDGDKFAWQSGCSAFTVGCTRIGIIKNYIDNQEAHHKKTTYLEELEEFLQLHEVEYERKYL
ncbi:MAG: transposase [Planctomycetes bacterium]|nr:transposase [Planctomycetota bacterium]